MLEKVFWVLFAAGVSLAFYTALSGLGGGNPTWEPWVATAALVAAAVVSWLGSIDIE